MKPSLDAEKHKQLDREVRDMVNAITGRVTQLHKAGSSSHHQLEDDHDDDRGVRIITLAGTNNGATMRSDNVDDKSKTHNLDHDDEPDAFNTFVNSNFQAVNNSIMLDSSYNTNDPGVHMDVSESYAHQKPATAQKSKKKDILDQQSD